LSFQGFRSPIFHIVALGALLGLVLVVVVGPRTAGEEARRVVITGNDLAQLQVAFMRTWQRQPTRIELRGELEKYIREEILYREALARGYDRDDVVVRRAMQRKMEFLAQAQGQLDPPSDEEVQAYFTLRQERYRVPGEISFLQVYFSPDARGESAGLDAAATLDRIRQVDPGPAELVSWGDPIMLDTSYAGLTEQQVKSLFGDDFAAAVFALEVGSWQGPVRSGYGFHLVRVTRREDSYIPDWTAARQQVLTDMAYEANNAAKDQLFQEIAQSYQVLLDDDSRRLLDDDSE